jgi:hypothetical protein
MALSPEAGNVAFPDYLDWRKSLSRQNGERRGWRSGAPDSLSDHFFRLDRISLQSGNGPARGRGDHYIDGSHRFRAPPRAGEQ